MTNKKIESEIKKMTDLKVVGYSKKPNKNGYYDVCFTVGKVENYVGEFAFTVAMNAEKMNNFGIYDKAKETPIIGAVISTLDNEVRSTLKESGWHREIWISKKSNGFI